MSRCTCPCSSGLGNDNNSSSQTEHSPYFPQPSWAEFIRAQEMLSILDDNAKKKMTQGGEVLVWEKDITLFLGTQAVLDISGASVYPFSWECSDPSVVLLQPTQSLSQAQIQALSLGHVRITATCVVCGCAHVYAWNVFVSVWMDEPKEDDGFPSPPLPSQCPCHCQLREELEAGGCVNYSGPKEVVDLGIKEITLSGVSSCLTLGKNVTLLASRNVFTLSDLSSLTIEGEGRIVSGEVGWGGETESCLIVGEGCEVLIKGCSWKSYGQNTPIIVGEGGKITILSGTFESMDPIKGDEIVVKGGRWIGYYPLQYVPDGWDIGMIVGKENEWIVEEFYKHPKGKEIRDGETIEWPSYYV